jgi:hypothetical protein
MGKRVGMSVDVWVWVLLVCAQAYVCACVCVGVVGAPPMALRLLLPRYKV